ncbi:MAG: cupin domain-containing protein [Dehalococcoidia bacterium]
MNYPPVRVVHAGDLRVEPLADPVDYLVQPYRIGTALWVDSGVPIGSDEAAEGARRSLATTEAVQFGVTEVGPGGGETWHHHLSYYDILIYVAAGRGEFWWEDGGVEHREPIAVGDFVHISPGAKNQWLNTGDEVLRFVWLGHYHNYPRPEKG